MRIGLISCTKSKTAHAAPARDLYLPSTLFRGQRAYVERTCDRWFILSAKYGLLDPDDVVEPYEQTLRTAPIAERRAWSERTLASIEEHLGDLRGHTFECHAGSPYLDHGLVVGLLQRGAMVERPTEGLSFGRQLAFYASGTRPAVEVAVSATGPTDQLAPTPPASVEATTQRAVVDAMLSFGATLDADDLIAIGPDPESDALIRQDPFAFLLAVIFDQGIRYERAWRAPFDLLQRLGTLDPAALVADPEAVRQAVAQPPALHRYINNMPSWIVSAAERVLRECEGDAERIWNDRPSAEELRRRFESFHGIGQKKAAMAVEILERQRGVEVLHLEGSDIAFDVHVRRVFLRTGLADRDDSGHMIARARELHPTRPGELDYPAWWIGHEWCHPRDPECGACPLDDVCPKLFATRAAHSPTFEPEHRERPDREWALAQLDAMTDDRGSVSRMPERQYLKHEQQWDVTQAAIRRLAARLRRPFTYGDLARELKEHDDLEIDGRGFAGALNAVAKHTPTTQPLWTVLVVNQETGRPSSGFWEADYADIRYREVAKLSDARIDRWLAIQQTWCIARARVIESPLDQSLLDDEIAARELAETALIDLRLEQHREDVKRDGDGSGNE